jgi:PAS domain S-box-containing protein
LTLTLLFLLALLLGSYLSFHRLAEANRWNIHTYKVLLELRSMRESLVSMETAARGFVTSGDETFLPQFHDAQNSYERHWKQAQQLTRDRDSQQQRLQQLRIMETYWHDRLMLPFIELRRRLTNRDMLFRRVEAGVVSRKAQMDKMRNLLEAMETTENQLLQEREQEQFRGQALTRWALLAGGLSSLLLASALMWLVAQNLQRANRANLRLQDEMRERERTEYALRASEHRFRTFMDNSPVIAYVKDLEGRFTYVNQPATERFQLPVEQWLGKTDFELWPETATRLRDNDQRVIESQQMMAIEEDVATPDGKSQHWLSFKFPLQDGDRQYLAGLSVDVTEQKRADARLRETVRDLERSNAELEQFAYVASHDLQEPLRAIGGCVQVLQRRYSNQLDERADQFIKHAVEGAQRMQSLINDLLAFSRVGTHGRAFEMTGTSVILNTVLHTLKMRIEETGAIITHDEMPAVWGDSGQLEQVLQNLLSNALKFRHPETPRIHVGCRRDEDNPQMWRFWVQDNGLGIDAQYFERIFVVFQRLHTRVEYPGTGIGLAICKKIIERHGGYIAVESEPGQGSTFFFTLPGSPTGTSGETHGTAEAGNPQAGLESANGRAPAHDKAHYEAHNGNRTY